MLFLKDIYGNKQEFLKMTLGRHKFLFCLNPNIVQNICNINTFINEDECHLCLLISFRTVSAVGRGASPSPQGHSCWSRVWSFSELVQPQSDARTRHLGRVHSQNRSKQIQTILIETLKAGVFGVLKKRITDCNTIITTAIYIFLCHPVL